MKVPTKSVKDRVAEYRQRQREQGRTTLSLVVPQSQARFFRELAAIARQKPARKRKADRPGDADPIPQSRLSGTQFKLAERWIAASKLELSPTRPDLSLSRVLAYVIAYDVASTGWRRGTRIGTQAELMARFGVGRNLLRDAIQLLQHVGVAHMQRGEGAALIASHPSLDFAADIAALYLSYRGIDRDRLIDLRRALERYALARCIAHDRSQSVERLRMQLLADAELEISSATPSRLQQFHVCLAQSTGEPVVEFSMAILLRLWRQRARSRGVRIDAQWMKLHLELRHRIVDAMATGDFESASVALDRVLELNAKIWMK